MRIPFLAPPPRDYALEPLTPTAPGACRAASRGFRAAVDRRRVRALLEQDTVFGYAGARDRQGGKPPGRLCAGAAGGRRGEILTLAVARSHRRQGLGWQLMDAVLREFMRSAPRALFLEVDETNVAAIALYRRLGFREVGKRPRYYKSPRARPDRRACHAPRSSLARGMT